MSRKLFRKSRGVVERVSIYIPVLLYRSCATCNFALRQISSENYLLSFIDIRIKFGIVNLIRFCFSVIAFKSMIFEIVKLNTLPEQFNHSIKYTDFE